MAKTLNLSLGASMTRDDEPSDAALIDGCLQGSASAWDTLVARYERLVYTIPRRYGLTADEVDDVFQAVWLRLLEKLPTLTDPDRVSAWLVTTARRECWDRRRGSQYTRVDAVDPLTLPITTDDTSPEALVLQYEQQQALRVAMAQLDERCRQLLHALYYEAAKPSYHEIAERLKLAVGSIGPIRARCLQHLREAWQK